MELLYKEIILPTSHTEFNIYFLGDFHIGHVNSDENKLEKHLKQIEKEKHSYCFIMGDIADKREPDHKYFDPAQLSKNYSLKHFVNNCYKRFKGLIKPISKKIIGIHVGNHDLCGSSNHWIEEICADFNVPYLGYRALTQLLPTLKNSNPTGPMNIFTTHGSGGGRKSGAKINRIEDEAVSTIADIYAQGHTHYLSYTERLQHYAQKYGGSLNLKEKELFFINTGSYLKSYTQGNYCYSEKASYPPQPTGCVKMTLTLTSRGKKLKAEILK